MYFMRTFARGLERRRVPSEENRPLKSNQLLDSEHLGIRLFPASSSARPSYVHVIWTSPALCRPSTPATFLTLILAKESPWRRGSSIVCSLFLKAVLRTSVHPSICSQPLKLKLSHELSGVSVSQDFHFLQTGAFTLQGGLQARMCPDTELGTEASLY